MKIIECPRDAMQGLSEFIPTENKIRYINALLEVGFDTIDFGSFVSPAAIPQMRDTEEVLEKLQTERSRSKLLAIVANLKGVEQAVKHKKITYLGFPLSVSETFQQRNTNKSIAQSFEMLEKAQEICIKNDKTLVVYISMGFGNPYGEVFNAEIIAIFVKKLLTIGVKIVSLSDTVGAASPELITEILPPILREFPQIETGVHLHSEPETAKEKIDAAFQAGCRRFDAAIGGLGGCPMATDKLTGNISTEILVNFCQEIQFETGLNKEKFDFCTLLAKQIFPH
jgi:hydroxymethylglutaryl-CoA lyase